MRTMNIEKTSTLRLKQTTPEAFEMLKAKVAGIMTEVKRPEDKVTDKTINFAALHVAIQAEEEGIPYTEDAITNISAGSKEESRILEALGLRLKVEKDLPKERLEVTDSHGNYIGSTESRGEVAKMTKQVREEEGNLDR